MKKLIAFCCVVLIAGFAMAQNNKSQGNEHKSANGTQQTKPVKVKAVIKTADLMPEITDHIAKNYDGYTISKAEKVTTDKVVTYDVLVMKGETKTTFTYNDKGAFVKAKVHPAATHKTEGTGKPKPKTEGKK
jgi:hypothetical protein